jgi:Predicted membrane protein (DUF2142)
LNTTTSAWFPRVATGIFLPTFLLIAALTTLWALASPIFSSPDENAHATKAIAQVRGQILGYQVEGVQYTVVDLPDEYRYNSTILCFAYNPDATADCGTELGDPVGTAWFNTWVGSYNPTYYFLVGWPSLFLDGSSGVYGMRIVSGLMCAALLASATSLAMRAKEARWMPIGMVFIASPMVLYLAGSVTPQGLEVASSVLLWVALLRLLHLHSDAVSPSAQTRTLWIATVVGAGLLANARALGPLWVLVLAGVCVAVVGWRPTRGLFELRTSYPWLAVIALACIFSASWTISGGSLSGQADVSDVPLVGGTFLQGAWAILRGTPQYIQQATGVFGWLDTVLPTYAYGTFYVAFALATVLAFIASGRRGGRVMVILVVVAVLVPMLVQGYSVRQTGIIWQGRYGLFLYLGLPIVGATLLSAMQARAVGFLSSRLTSVVAGLIAIYGILAFALVLRRYVVGQDEPVSRMLTAPAWQPPLGWVWLLVAYAIFAVLFSTWMIVLARRAAQAPAQLVDV